MYRYVFERIGVRDWRNVMGCSDRDFINKIMTERVT